MEFILDFLHRTWAEIDLDALVHNFDIIKKEAAGAKLMAVVKADAYGHSARIVAPTLEQHGADAFAVSNIEEAITLRGCGITRPILILGYTPVSMAAQLYLNDISQCVYSPEYARALSQRACADGVKVKIHIKLDTGMSRLGFDCRDEELSGIGEAVAAARLSGFVFEGIFTHFAVSDRTETEEDGFTDGWYHPTHKDKPIKVHNSMKGRDGRFYASIFFNGMYWIHKDATKPEYKPVTFFTGGTSAFAHESGDYVKTGFLFTKYTDPTIDTRKNVWGSFTWCYMRLAEIYLNYAEACNEKPERDAEEALKYLNKLRKRAGINVKIETAYPQALTDREVLRDIIRRERMVELAYEGLRYYDLRTWMIADKEANGARYGLDLTARDYESSWERTSKICLPIVFETKHYLFPIGQKQLNEMKNFTQNQGW